MLFPDTKPLEFNKYHFFAFSTHSCMMQILGKYFSVEGIFVYLVNSIGNLLYTENLEIRIHSISSNSWYVSR